MHLLMLIIGAHHVILHVPFLSICKQNSSLESIILSITDHLIRGWLFTQGGRLFKAIRHIYFKNFFFTILEVKILRIFKNAEFKNSRNSAGQIRNLYRNGSNKRPGALIKTCQQMYEFSYWRKGIDRLLL